MDSDCKQDLREWFVNFFLADNISVLSKTFRSEHLPQLVKLKHDQKKQGDDS